MSIAQAMERGRRAKAWRLLLAAAAAGCLALMSAAAAGPAQAGQLADPFQPIGPAQLVNPAQPGLDIFPSRGRVEVEFAAGQKVWVPLVQDGLPDMVVQRQAQVGGQGGTIDTEIVQMQLQGHIDGLGPVQVRVGRAFGLPPSVGQVTNVRNDENGHFASGDSFFDVFFEVELTQSGVFAQNPQPLRMTATNIRSLPPNLPGPTPQEAFSLSHYKCYQVARSGFRSRRVRLNDQFENKSTGVARPVLLCNPVRKTFQNVRSTIRNRRAHLVCYRIPKGKGFKQGAVGIRNQFGAATLDVKRRDTLCLPSTKKVLRRGRQRVRLPRVRGLDHFKCYRAKHRGEALSFNVRLADQFETHNTKARGPDTLCNPVEKKVGKRTTKIQNPLAHLVFHPISKRRVRRIVAVRNQFGVQVLRVTRRHSLGVPTHKTPCTEYAEKAKIALQVEGQTPAHVINAIHVPFEAQPDSPCPG